MTDQPDGLTGVLAGRYRIDREIGRGGMATVYLALDLRHDAMVAVKVLRPELATRLGGERFFREIRITAGLQHPNIVPIFDSGESDGHSFYVMPYVEGETLADRLEREGPLPVDEVLAIAGEVASALAYAHAQGFVHRDVKPSNVLLSHGHARLADFGIARAVDVAGADRLTETGLAIGTAAYMSPEQALGDPLDARSDIYSLACVVYEMLAGAPPFTGTARAIMARHSADTIPSLRTVRDVVSARLETAIFKALAKTPADRYADAAEFGAALRAARAAGARTGIRWPPHRRWVIGAAAVLGAALLIWRGGLPEAGALDANRVMVLPLIPPAGFTGSPSVGEDVATLIGHSVNGAEPLHWIDGWPLLEPAVRQSIQELAITEARDLARANRCAFIVWGRIRTRGDSADVTLDLHDVRTGDLTSEIGTSTIAEPWRAGLRAVNRLLPTMIQGSPDDVEAEWTDRKPAAIASFLLAEAAFRRLDLETALDHYRNAIRTDSTFALAAIRGAQAATWNHRPGEAGSLIDVAKSQPLPARYASFARGYEAYLEGRADSAIAAFRSATDADASMTAAWMQLGETYTHLLPDTGTVDRLADAAFEEARRLDPNATNLLFHLIEIRLRQGDTERAAPLVARFRDASPDATLASQVEIMAECVADGPDRVDWERHATQQPLPLLAAAGALAGGGYQLPCSEAAYRAILGYDTTATGDAAARRFPALMGLQSVLVAQGRVGEAVTQIDAWFDRWKLLRAEGLYLLDAVVVDSLADRAREIARADAEVAGADYRGITSSLRLWELGVWAAHSGDSDVAGTIASRIEEIARRDGGRREDQFGRSVRAWVTLARGDTASALRMFDELIPAAVPSFQLKWFEDEPLGAERLTLARLLLARGQYERAIGVASVLDAAWPTVYPLYLRQSLIVRLEAAGAMRKPVLESQYRDRLERLARGQTGGHQ